MKKFIIFLIVPFLSFGQCVKGNCLDGEGLYMWDDGMSFWQGEFKDNVLHGMGTLKHFDKNGVPYGIYDGEWKNGYKDGWGTATYYGEDGVWLCSYTGNWKNNTQHGYGVMIWSFGTIEEGEYINGEFQK